MEAGIEDAMQSCRRVVAVSIALLCACMQVLHAMPSTNRRAQAHPHHDVAILVEAGAGRVRCQVGEAALVHGARSPLRATEVHVVPLTCHLVVGVCGLGQVPARQVAAAPQPAVVGQHEQDALVVGSHAARVV